MILALTSIFCLADATFYNQGKNNIGNDFSTRGGALSLYDSPVSSFSSQLSALTSLLEYFSSDPKARQLLHGVPFSRCPGSLSQAAQLTRTLEELVSATSPSLEQLEADWNSLKDNQNDVVASMRISARLLETMATIPARIKSFPVLSECSYGDSYTQLYELSTFLYSLSNARPLQEAIGVPESLRRSSLILRETTHMLGELEAGFSRIPNICLRQPDIIGRGIAAINNIFNVVEGLFTRIGYSYSLAQVRHKAIMNAHSLLTKIYLIQQRDIELYGCDSLARRGNHGTASSMEAMALMLKDLSDIVEEIGLEEFEKEIGVNLRFNFI